MRTGGLILLFTVLMGWHCSAPSSTLTVYSGRSKALVEPVISMFEEETGIAVKVRYGGTTQLAMAIMEEGRRSPADVFWSQDAGALAALSRKQLLSELSGEILAMAEGDQAGRNSDWIATSGRARVLAYHQQIDPSVLPESIMGLPAAADSFKVGWAPSNASFQSFLAAMVQVYGEEETRAWIRAMKQAGAVAYINNNALIEAIAAGEIRLAITNHYYLERIKSRQADYPVEQKYFAHGDPGNLLNLSGVALLRSSDHTDTAEQFIRFLLSDRVQAYFAKEIFEFPVRSVAIEAGSNPVLQHGELFPNVMPESFDEIDVILEMLRQEGLL